VEVSLLHSAVAALVNVAQNVLVADTDARRWGNAHANLCPYELFATSDGSIVVAVGSDLQWLACARALQLHDLADDPGLRTNAGRLAQRTRIVERLRERLASQGAAHWGRALQVAGVPCGVVKTVREALSGISASSLIGIAPQPPGRVRFPPPRLDEHGALVREHGWAVFRTPLATPDPPR
jgi:formyl-CoA transferase